jgi:hypothetical protein
LLKSIKQLGEIYVKNPQHFSYIFQVVENLCGQIKQSIDANKEGIDGIRQANNNIMQLEEQELFPEQTYDLLESTHATISRLSKQVQDYREEVAQAEMQHQNTLAIETQKAKDEIFGIAVSLARIHHLAGYEPRPSHSNYHQERDVQREVKTTKLTPIKTISTPTDPHIHFTFWQKYRLRIVGAILAICSLVCVVVAAIISLLSGGALSPLGIVLGAIGVKIGFTGLALAGIDGAIGLVVGLFLGSIISSAILSVDVFRLKRSSHQHIKQTLMQHRPSDVVSDKQQLIDMQSIPDRVLLTTNLFANQTRSVANPLILNDEPSENKKSLRSNSIL